MGGHRLEDFWYDRHTAYDAIRKRKDEHTPAWNQLISGCHGLSIPQSRFRDAGDNAVLHGHRLFIGFEGGIQGIVLNISYLTNHIGFYYCHHRQPALYPIFEKNGAPLPHISYCPYNDKQLTLARACFLQAQLHFPDFILFDNLFATRYCEKMIVNRKLQDNAELFLIVFGDRLDAVL
jgi:hypothetical protein